eukprot:Lankesteria_metandrocarpae@DN8163_c0_g1_i1.p1
MLSVPILVLDNGSGCIKAGYGGEDHPRVKVPNFVGVVRKGNKKYYGDQLHTLQEYFLQRPHKDGLLLDAEMQRDIWDKIFAKQCMNIDPARHGLVVTEPFNCPASLRHAMAEVIFEDFGFAKMVACPAQQLIVYAFPELHFLTEGGHSSSKPAAHTRSSGRSSSKRSTGVISIGDDAYPALLPRDIAPRTTTTTTGGTNAMRSDLPPVDPLSLQVPCQVVVDCGHQSCWAIPFYGELPIEIAALRMNLGGQHLTSYLRSLVTYRHTDVERNELIVQNMKESCCRVSQNFSEDMRIAAVKQKAYSRRHIGAATDLFTQYTLPDFTVKDKQILHEFFSNTRHNSTTTLAASDEESLPDETAVGANQEVAAGNKTGTPEMMNSPSSSGGRRGADKQFVRLNNESISVPEVLFHPADAGFVDTCGIAELIYRSIRCCPPQLQQYMASNILLTGGCAKFQGFGSRLHSELRVLLPQHWRIHIQMLENPECTVWRGGSKWAAGSSSGNNNFETYSICKEVYFDRGKHGLRRGETPK